MLLVLIGSPQTSSYKDFNVNPNQFQDVQPSPQGNILCGTPAILLIQSYIMKPPSYASMVSSVLWDSRPSLTGTSSLAPSEMSPSSLLGFDVSSVSKRFLLFVFHRSLCCSSLCMVLWRRRSPTITQLTIKIDMSISEEGSIDWPIKMVLCKRAIWGD